VFAIQLTDDRDHRFGVSLLPGPLLQGAFGLLDDLI
jgi:hypothetical protein